LLARLVERVHQLLVLIGHLCQLAITHEPLVGVERYDLRSHGSRSSRRQVRWPARPTMHRSTLNNVSLDAECLPTVVPGTAGLGAVQAICLTISRDEMEVDTPDVSMGGGGRVEATRFDVYKLLKAVSATRWPAQATPPTR